MKKQLKKLTPILAIFILSISISAEAQTTEVTDSVMVKGNCGMCKKNIEKSATEAGATYALWNRRTKMLNVRYEPSLTNMKKIEQKIADTGYDTENMRGSDEAYEKLEECCQYERKEATQEKKQ